jgi:hypothetical protein
MLKLAVDKVITGLWKVKTGVDDSNNDLNKKMNCNSTGVQIVWRDNSLSDMSGSP